MKKAIIIYNWILIGIILYFMCLPLITPIMVKIVPNFWICPYSQYTGRDCPFCGITTDLYHVLRNPKLLLKIHKLKNPVSGIILVLGISEFLYRIMLFKLINKLKNYKFYLISDITIHSILSILFFCTAIYFWNSGF